MPSPLRPLVVPALLALALAAAGCSDQGGAAAEEHPRPSATTEATPTPTPGGTAVPHAAPGPDAFPLPTDCRAILTDGVLAQFGGTPLNDPAYGEAVGVQEDGSLVCLWRHPGADVTALQTTIAYVDEEQTMGVLNGLMEAEGYTCYEPDEGVRCEKTWENEDYPVTDGRTLYYRDGVLIDTVYSNLAPTGYTAAVVRGVWAAAPTPTPTPTPTTP